MDENNATRIDRIALGIVIVAGALVIGEWFYIVIGHARFFDGYFANGAFQLLNPLRRFMDGQVLGRDFLVFHGFGTIWLHLPAYVIFGQTLVAAEISRFLTSGLLHALACIWLWRALAPRVGSISVVILALLFLVATALVQDKIWLPHNSLLGTRSIFPIYVALALLSSANWAAIAALACAALLVSPEHGIATVAGLAAVVFLHALSKGKRTAARDIGLALLIAVLLFYLVMWVVSAGSVIPNIRYALLDIPGDQFWYFGVRPNLYLPVDWPYLFHVSFLGFAVLWALSVLLTVKLWRARSTYRAVAVFLVVYATFGTISLLGYLFSANLQGSERALFLVLILAAAHFCDGRRISILAMVALAVLSVAGFYIRFTAGDAFPRARAEPGEFLSPYWKKHLAAVEEFARGGSIWSIYVGLPEYERNMLAPSFDYIIHAVGPKNRDLYSRKFDEISPSLVRLDNAGTWGYGPWLIGSNWDFYQRVFSRYELSYEDRMATLWTPADQPQPGTDAADGTIPLPTEDNCFEFEKPAGEESVYSFNLEYSLKNPWGRIPVIGKTPRLILISDGPNDDGVSLPPPQVYGGAWTVPFVLKGDDTVKYCIRLDTFLPMVSAQLHSVSADPAPVTDSARQYLLEVLQ